MKIFRASSRATKVQPATSFVERCGSVGANNGCQRNFNVNNNFSINIVAESTPVELTHFDVE